MKLLEAYKYFQAGVVKFGVNETTQRFFKTNPTEEQILLLDKISDQSNIITYLFKLVYLLIGVEIGIMFAICLFFIGWL